MRSKKIPPVVHLPDRILDILIEECAEVIQASTKIKRFGEDALYSGNDGYVTNRESLHRELGDMFAVLSILEIDIAGIGEHAREKEKTLRQMLGLEKRE